MNNDGGGDELKKIVSNLGSVDLNLSEVEDVSVIYDYLNSVLKDKPKTPGSDFVEETGADSSSALQGTGTVSDCFYHIHKHGSHLGVRLLLPALNRVLCSDRVSQMTKTYNDVEAVTRLLEEKEKDIELTARIGKELLAHNQKLESTVAALEVEIKAANEKIIQLTYDLHRKTELINVLTNDDSCSEASTPTGSVSLEFMQRRIGLLENENKVLRDETSQLASQTDEIEAQEAKLYAELSEQLSAARVDVSCLTEEADRCREESRIAQNLASTLQEKLSTLEQKYNDLTMSNEDMSNILGFAKQTQEELTTELAELRERYAEVLGFLHDTQEALKQVQKKNQPTAKGGSLYASLQPHAYQTDSLAMELESSLFSELSLDSGISTDRGLPHYKKVFDTVRCASRGSSISSGRSSECSPYPDPLMKPSLYKPMSSDLLVSSSLQPRMSSHYSSSGTRSHRLSSITLDSAGLTDSDSSIDDFYNYPSSAAGVPGIPGSEDLAAALNKLTPGEVAARRRQLSSGVFSSHMFDPSETPRTPDSIMSTGSSGAFPFGFGMVSTPWRLPEKLQIVKPMEGSQTLQHWSQLATPSMGGLLEEKPGIKIRGGKDLEALGLHVFTLDEVEEDDEVIHPGKSFQNSGSIYTYTNSMVMHPDDNTSVSASIAGSRMSTAANSRASSVAPTPLSRSRRNSCSTFSTGLGLAKLLNERGIQAATPSTFTSPHFSPTATPCNSPTRTRSPSPTFSPFTLPSYLMSSGAKLLRRTLTGSSSQRSRSTSRNRDTTVDKKPLGEIKLVETIERIGLNTLMSTTASDTNISAICSQLSMPATIDSTSSCLGIPGKPGSGILESRLNSLPNSARRRPTSGKMRQDLGVVLGSVSSLQRNDSASPPTTVAQSTSSPALGTLNKNERKAMERTSNVLSRLSKKSSESNDIQLAWSSTESHPDWFQLSGHPDCFAPAGPGTIWKKCSDSSERDVYEALSKEPTLQDVIPRYLRTVEHDGQTFIELQDLLDGFDDPQVMDIKLGVRTFLESEVQNTTERQDLYKKMVAIDPNAPTDEEKRIQAVTKLRYMQFRENQSSTCSQGFRIEAIKLSGEPPRSNLQRVKSIEDVQDTLKLFLQDKEEARSQLVNTLKKIRNKLEQTQFLKNHEVVGSSILIIHDNSRVGAWLIDFGKTRHLPPTMTVNHRAPWIPGNHEEGLLFGLDNLIKILENLKLGKTTLQDHT